VGFNYRYSPPRAQVKDLLMSGEIGEVLSVDFHWLLNTHHGADYFRRWHSHKRNSGGLLVHKSTHHFDLLNWWLAAVPAVGAGQRAPAILHAGMARRLGLSGAHERCLTCPEKSRCGFYLDLAASSIHRNLYFECEKPRRLLSRPLRVPPGHRHRGHDECRWSATTTASRSATRSNAFNAWEGYTVAFNGTKGRLEHTTVESIYINGAETAQGAIADGDTTTRVIPLRGEPRTLTPWTFEGDHGGGDRLMLEDFHLPSPAADKYLRAADHRAGACSIFVGIAANRSLATGAEVRVADLVPSLPRPDYAPMPSREGPLPMPVRQGVG
jgi:predicted dehydrogenase